MAGKLSTPLTGYRGDDLRHTFRFHEPDDDPLDPTYVDFTGWTGTSQLRVDVDDAAAVGEFVVTPDPDQVANMGVIRIAMGHEDSAVLPVGKLKWDLQMVTPQSQTTGMGWYLSRAAAW